MRKSTISAVLLFASAAALALAPAAGAQTHNVSNTPGLAEGEEPVAVNPTDSRNLIVGPNQWLPPSSSNPTNFGIGPSGATTCAVWSSHGGGPDWVGGLREESRLGRDFRW